MNHRLVQITKSVSSIAIVVSVLLWTVYLFLNNPYTSKFIESLIRKKAVEEFSVDIKIGSSQITLFPLGLTFHNLSASVGKETSVTQSQESSFVFMSKVSLNMSYLELLLGMVRIDEVQVVDGRMRIDETDVYHYLEKAAVQADGSNRDRPSATTWWLEKKEQPVSFINKIDLVNFQIDYFFQDDGAVRPRDLLSRSQSGQFSVQQLDAELDFSANGITNLSVDANHIVISRPGQDKFPEMGLSGQFKLDGLFLNSQQITVKSGSHTLKGELESEIRLNSDQNKLDGWKYFSRWNGELSIEDIGLFAEAPRSSGVAELSSVLEGFVPLGDSLKPLWLQLGGEINGKDVVWDNLAFGNLKSEIYSNGNQLWLKNLNLIRHGDSVLEADGKVDLKSDLPIQLKMKPQNLSLAETLNIFNAQTDEVNFNFLSGDVELKGHLAPLNLSLKGPTKISKTHIAALSRVPKEEGADLPLPQGLGHLDVQVTSDYLRFAETWIKFESPKDALEPKTSLKNKRIPAGNQQLQLKLPDSVGAMTNLVHFSGGFDYSEKKSSMDLMVNAERLDLSTLEPLTSTPMAGQARTSVRIWGDFDGRIQTKLDIRAREVATQNARLNYIDGEFDFGSGRVTWQGVRAQFLDGGFLYSKQGALEYQGLALVGATARFQNISTPMVLFLEDVLFIDLPFQVSKADVEMNLESGRLLMPGTWVGRVRYKSAAWTYEDLKVYGRSRFNLDMDHKIWSMDDIEISYGDRQIVGLLQIPRRQAKASSQNNSNQFLGFNLNHPFLAVFQVSSNSRNTTRDPYELFGFHSDVYGWFKKHQLYGKLSGQVTLSGTFAHPEGKFNFQMKEPHYKGARIGNLMTSSTFVGGKFEGSLDYDGGAAIGRYAVDFSKKVTPLEFYLRFKQLDLRPLLPQNFASDPRNFAYIDGDWSFASSLNDIWNGSGRFELRGMRMKYLHPLGGTTNSLQLRTGNKIAMLFSKGGGWKMDPELDSELHLKGTEMEYRFGLAPSSFPNNMRLKGSGFVRMALARSLIEQVDLAQGQVALNLRTTGSVFNPSWKLEIQNDTNAPGESELLLGLGRLKPAFKNIKLKGLVENGLIKIDYLSAEKGKGKIKIDGVVDLMQYRSSRLRMEFDRSRFILPLPLLRNLDLELSGNMMLSGDQKPYSLKGDMTVVKAASVHNGEFVADVVNGLREASVLTSSLDSSEEKKPPFNMSVRFHADRSIVVRNKNMNVVGSGDVVLVGTPAKPNLLGRILVDDGFLFYKHRFDVQVGELVFDHPSKIDPKMNLIAVTNIGDYRVGLNITGEASRAGAELMVDPSTYPDGSPISPTDAFLLLSTGSLPNKDSQGSGEALGVGLSEALNNVFAEGKVPFEKLSERIGQDKIRLYPDFTVDGNGNTVLQFNVVLRLFDQIEAAARQSASGRWETTLEVPVHSQVSFLGGVSQEQSTLGRTSSESSVDLRFRFPVRQ